MKKISVVLAVSICLFFACKKNEPTSISLDQILIGEWTYTELDFRTFFNDSLVTSELDMDGTIQFRAGGSGTIRYSDNVSTEPISWNVVSEQEIEVNFNNTVAVRYDVLINEENRQKWSGVFEDGQGSRAEIKIDMRR